MVQHAILAAEALLYMVARGEFGKPPLSISFGGTSVCLLESKPGEYWASCIVHYLVGPQVSGETAVKALEALIEQLRGMA
jgi:hypothetical protein